MKTVKRITLCLCLYLAATGRLSAAGKTEAPPDGAAAKRAAAAAAVPSFVSVPETAPRWVTNLPPYNAQTGNEYFWGFSGRFPTLGEAVASAERDAKLRIAGTIAELIEGTYAETSVYRTSMEQVTEDTESVRTGLSAYTGGIIENVKPGDDDPATEDMYQKRYSDGTVEVQIIVNVPRPALENAGKSFREEISAEYSARIDGVSRASFSAAARGYEDIRKALTANPLHRAAAVYAGGAKCYDVAASRLRELAGTVAFDTAAPSAYTVHKKEALILDFALRSGIPLGQVECVLRYSGAEAGMTAFPDAGNRLRFRIDTASLPAGSYRGSVELRLSALSPELRSVTREFTFTVTLPPPPDKPLAAAPFGGVWSGAAAYSAGGRTYRDSYTINVYADGTCWVTVTDRDGASQAAAGRWSEGAGVFRIENCVFDDPAIARLHSLRWVSAYTLEDNNRALRLTIQPAPDYSGVVRLTLNRER